MTTTNPAGSIELRSRSLRLKAAIELLSSMRFAISLLTVICIASVIGTILPQGDPLVNYVDKFGPFWTEVFLALKLNAVYSSGWFLAILGFLVVSTSLCIARNTPKIIKELKAYKENIREQSLRAFHHRAEASVTEAPADAAMRIGGSLAQSGWKVRLQQRETGWMVAAKRGGANKIGYLAAHGAVVLVCIGGLMDGDLIVRAQMWWHDKTPYANGELNAALQSQHRLPASNPAFRGNLFVAEGSASSSAILTQPDGSVIQELPFSIELKKFIVEYYPTGMPKLFASDVVIRDHETGEGIPARIEVNKPASYKGVQIYQSSFDDGGSRVKLKAVPVNGGQPFEVEGVIGAATRLTGEQDASAGAVMLEYTGLRVINVENVASPDAKKQFRDMGPSIGYKLRDAAGQAREFNNYMRPADLGDGVPVFLMGVRETPAEPFRYLRVPADDQGGLDGFVRLRQGLLDSAMREEAVRRYAKKATNPAVSQRSEQLTLLANRALTMFAGVGTPNGPNGSPVSGLQAISDFMQANVPEGERVRGAEVLLRILNGCLFELAQITREEAGLVPLDAGETTQGFMTHAVVALSDVNAYPVPMAFELQDFKHVQASVFQVARGYGKYVVYLGSALLMLGIVAMLYVRERRVWCWLARDGEGAHCVMALSTNRSTLSTDREFEVLKEKLLR